MGAYGSIGGEDARDEAIMAASRDRVNVGNFDSNGLNVNYNDESNRNDWLGRSLARNFYLLF